MPLSTTWGRVRSARRRQRATRRRRTFTLQHKVITWLNWLWHGGADPPPKSGGACSRGTAEALKRVKKHCEWYSRRVTGVATGPAEGSDLIYGKCNKYEQLVAERVSLPKREVAGKAKLLDLLALRPSWREVYASEANCIKPEVAASARYWNVPAPSRGCTMAEWGKLMGRAADVGMVEFRETRPKWVDGCFGVAKGVGELRLIVNKKLGNALWVDPPKTVLPHLGIYSEVYIKGRCYTAKSDLVSYYYTIQVPEWWWDYQGLPDVWSTDVGLPGRRRRVWPVLKVLAMGHSHAVALGEAIHEMVLYATGALDPRRQVNRLTSVGELTVLRNAWGNPTALAIEYKEESTREMQIDLEDPPAPMVSITIDDLVVSNGRTCEAVNRLIASAIEDGYAPNNLVPSKDKTIMASPEGEDELEALGVVHRRDGVLEPTAKQLTLVVAHTRVLLERGRATAEALAAVVGRWVWLQMLSRTCLSIWQQSFKFINLKGWGQRTRPLWQGVRDELECAMALAPMLRVDRGAALAPVVVASDASSFGQGVVYAEMAPAEVTELARAREVRGYPTLLTPGEAMYAGPRPLTKAAEKAIIHGRWRVGIKSRWRDSTMHINEKEVRAAVKGVERSARNLGTWGKRVRQPRAAMMVIVIFQQYLRVSEALNLLVGHVRLQPDVRLRGSQRGALLLMSAKTAKGEVQSVVIEDVMTETLLRACMRGKAAWERVFPYDYAQFSRVWHQATQALGVDTVFTIHGLRHGGATYDFLRQRSMADIQHRGRWRSSKTVAHYVGLHRSLALTLPDALVRAIAACPPRIWRSVFSLPSS
eukprot:jgi/Mesvir1/3690/Mv14978-RA.1